MLTSPVPLVEFYSQLLPAARRAGYKVVLTALAREADSPPFYADVKRYWTSLDDLTGPQVLFVFAGANAAEELDKRGLQSDEDSVIYYAPNMAMRSKDDWRMKWDHSRDGYNSLRFFEDYLDRSYSERFRRRWREPTDNLPMKHTSELFELKQFMGIHEKQLPCLVFTLFGPGSHETGYCQRIIVPFSAFAHETTYLILKHLMELCEPHFQLIDSLEEEKSHLLRKKEKLESRRSVFGARAAVRSEVGHLSTPAVKTAVEEIISLTEKIGRTEKDRAECFTHLTTIGRTVLTQRGLISDLRRLIDLSFPRQNLVTSEDSRTASLSYTQQGIQTRLDELAQQIKLAWDGVACAISETAHESQALALNWDFFIAYANPDKWWAERLYDVLRRTTKPFLDKYCLLPGERWTQAIREAHNRSSCTIIVITNNTPKSWYAESEYLHAIKMARTRKHGIVPIFCGEPSEVPYGLEQLHALSIKECSDIESVCGKLVEALHKVQATP